MPEINSILIQFNSIK